MARILIQGASRGVGLQFCKTLLARYPEASIIASCRNPSTAEELQDIKQKSNDRLQIVKIDVTRENEINEVSQLIAKQFNGLDLLINSAGILNPTGRGETSLRDVSGEHLHQVLAVNTFGPLLMAKYFSPLLKNGNKLFGNSSSDHSGIFASVSAKVGSISDNGLGGWYAYRISKCGLNMLTKNLSIELGRGKKKILCLSLHPGTVETDLSRPYHKNVPKEKLFSAEYSVDCMLKIICNSSISDSGKFFSWDGEVIQF